MARLVPLAGVSATALVALVLPRLVCAQEPSTEPVDRSSQSVVTRTAPAGPAVRLLEWLASPRTPDATTGVAPTRPDVGLASVGHWPAADWTPLSVIGRAGHGAVYDPVRRRMLVVFGTSPEGQLNDAQALSLAGDMSWSPLAAADDGARCNHPLAVYDPVQDRVLVHGGYMTGPVDGPPGIYCWATEALLELRLSPTPRWSRLVPTGAWPHGRYGHAGIYDPVRGRVLVFGGRSTRASSYFCVPESLFSDLWELSLTQPPAWRRLTQSGQIPAPGLEGTALYDARRDRMLFLARDSVWAMTLAPDGDWTRLIPTGAGPDGVGPAALDPVRDRVLVQVYSRTWALSLGGTPAWEEIVTPAPQPEPSPGFSLTWDPEGDRVILFGGGSHPPERVGRDPNPDVWTLSFTGGPHWQKQEQLDPPGLTGHEAVYDPLRDRMLAMGGVGNVATWQFSLESPQGWARLCAGPAERYFSGAVYDPVRDRVLMQGGFVGPNGLPDGSTLALPLGGTAPRWSQLLSDGPALAAAALVYDARRDRLLLYGGMDAAEALHGEVWELPLAGDASWRQLAVPGPGPGPRALSRAVYDPAGDRMLVFGGINLQATCSDLWSLSLGEVRSWTRLLDEGPQRGAPTLVLDPVRQGLVLHAGDDFHNQGLQTWAFAFDRPYGWEALDWHCCGWDVFTPRPRAFHAAIYDPMRDAMLISGGADRRWQYPPAPRPTLTDVWALTWGEPVRDIVVDVRPGDEANAVNPGAGGVLPVAILSAGRFDATTVDPLSVRLAGAGVRVRGSGEPMAWRQDVDGDGRADLLLHVECGALRLSASDTMAVLTGRAPGNTTVRGQDRVRVIGGAGPVRGLERPLAAARDDGGPALRRVRVLPGAAGIAAGVTLRAAEPAVLELIDIAGRRLDRVTLEVPSAGERDVVLGRGLALRAGIYWVRLRQGEVTLTRKAIHLR